VEGDLPLGVDIGPKTDRPHAVPSHNRQRSVAQYALQRFEPSCDDLTGAQIKSGHS
jgi:hypothetical protein